MRVAPTGILIGLTLGLTQNRKFFAFCGVGNPAAFFEDLRRWKVQVVGTSEYRDHHSYSQSDADELEARAQAAGATGLVCTEKDLFSLRQVRFARLPLFSARIVLHIADAPNFWNEVNGIIERKRGGVR